MSWTVGPALFGVEWLICGYDVVWPVFAGTALGYLAYDYIHFYTHHARPRHAVGRWLRRYHLLHHHDQEEARFGVSSPLWDLVFGTYRPLRSAASPSARARDATVVAVTTRESIG
jgi:sterol desaturase/sphingolipid hydroxylase (fatty acid hydroxylase superfamily)